MRLVIILLRQIGHTNTDGITQLGKYPVQNKWVVHFKPNGSPYVQGSVVYL